MFESILERSEERLEDIQGVSEYVRRALEAYAPHVPGRADLELMRTWLSGQLLLTLEFMHDDPNILGMFSYEDPRSALKQVERKSDDTSPLEYTDTRYMIRGSVGLGARAKVCESFLEGRDVRQYQMARMPHRITLGADRWKAHLTDGEFPWGTQTTHYELSVAPLPESFGVTGKLWARIRILRDDTVLELLGTWWDPPDAMEVCELLVRLCREFPGYAPAFEVGDRTEAFETLWRCYRAIRSRR